MLKRGFCGVLVALAATAGLVAVPTAAQADVEPGGSGQPCYSRSCDGRNPVDIGCDSGAYTAAYAHTLSSPRAELRVSPGCRAAWARSAGVYRVTIERLSPYFFAYADANYYFDRWTVMAGIQGYTVRACYSNASSHGCTPWVTFY